MSLSTHVLDTSRGRPAAGVAVRLDARDPHGGDWRPVSDGRTDTDGRIVGWATDRAGVYRLVFDVGGLFGEQPFYPEATVTFHVADPAEHYHVPLLISPFGYSTYRGS